MCNPVMAGVVIAGAAINAYASAEEASAANQALEYNADILEYNAQVAGIKAEKAEEQGAVAESRFRKELSQAIGAQRAGYASAGVTVDQGTAGDIVAETRMVGEEDALTIRYNAALQAFDYRTQARDFMMRADLERMKQRDPLKAGLMGFLGGTTKLGATYALSK